MPSDCSARIIASATGYTVAIPGQRILQAKSLADAMALAYSRLPVPAAGHQAADPKG